LLLAYSLKQLACVQGIKIRRRV